MPSKAKKHLKSKLSQLDHQTTELSASSSSPNPHAELSEEELLSTIEAASRKYPYFIGTSAFIGRVVEGDPQSVGSKGFTIWLSESSMLASSISPGSTVSVSLASSRKGFSCNFPLSSLSDECARHFGFAYLENMVDEVGNYFALATVFPSCKVLHNEVRLSSNLSYSMGCPSSDRIVFVYLINNQSGVGLVNGISKVHTVNCLPEYRCSELYLSIVSQSRGFTVNSNVSSQIDFPAKTNHGQLNEKVSSPKTPSFSHSKLSSSSNSQLSEKRYVESGSNVANTFGPSFGLFDIKEVLGDESGKKLLQTCLASWLVTHTLLCGNLVIIPILSMVCIFQVIKARRISENSNIQDLVDKRCSDLYLQALDLVNNMSDAYFVDHETKIYFHSPLDSASVTPQERDLQYHAHEGEDVTAKKGVNISKLGGLSKEFGVLKDIIISSAAKETLSSLGLRPTKGVLLHGPAGTGKTSLARLCAHDAGVNLLCVNGPEVVSQYYGESELALQKVFNSACQTAPAVVFIDELDAIAPARKDGSDELSQRMIAALLNLMDGITRTDGILVIAVTNWPDSIEPALRRPGRLDREVEIGVPSPKQRYDILLALLSEMKHSLLDTDVQYLASVTHGFVGADLAALCNEAALVCLRHYIDFKKSSENCCNQPSITYDVCSSGTVESSDFLGGGTDPSLRIVLDSTCSSIRQSPGVTEILNVANATVDATCAAVKDILRVKLEDFEKARVKIRPSAMREVILEVPKVRWEDIGGQKEVKMQLMEAVEWPQKHQDAFRRIGTQPPRGVLLFGPPGCSKTLLARAVASEAGLNFLAVKGPELYSKWVGESEKALRSLFAKAKANAPSIIFFDEIDGLATIRGNENDGVSVADRVMSQLLVELDGLNQRGNVTVIAATNRPDKIDPALLRPGRFDRLLYVGLPSESEREDIFRINLRRMPCNSDVCIKELAACTRGYTGADIALICGEAAIAAIEERLDASEITMGHLITAIEQVQPSDAQSYQELSTKFQRRVQSAAIKDILGCQPCLGISSWYSFW